MGDYRDKKRLSLAAMRRTLAVFVISVLAVASSRGDDAAIDFARDVQPILASKCIRCHGPETQEAGLRLDERRAAVSELDSGSRAVAPKHPDESELLRRVTADESERMPPEEPPLTIAQIATLRQWIAEGSLWPDHWAYQPLKARRPPTFDDAKLEGWCRTAIDRFILAQLEKKSLSPSAEADRRTLLRRVYFDVTGLPPSPADVEEFLNDESADAYEKIVDRLLASPQYGERWARHWMDVVHYADSHGFEHDLPRSIWPYRDYLIDAFNRDLPYAQFVREQVAGEAIRERSRRQAFWRRGRGIRAHYNRDRWIPTTTESHSISIATTSCRPSCRRS
jgi:hypothetical protein